MSFKVDVSIYLYIIGINDIDDVSTSPCAILPADKLNLRGTQDSFDEYSFQWYKQGITKHTKY